MPEKFTAVQLYRKLLREARLLPHAYLSFYRLHYQVEFRRYGGEDGDSDLTKNRIDRAKTELRMLERANTGRHERAFDRMLDMAYGRKGPLKQELFKPVRDAPPELPLLPHDPNTRSPGITPLFGALATASAARHWRQKTSSHAALRWPLQLTVRDSPEHIQLCGPIPKRRVANARKKAFRTQSEAVYPPLEILGETDVAAELPFQGTGLQQEVSMLAGVSSPHSPIKGVSDHSSESKFINPVVPAMPTRFLRRRYASLLRRLPVVTVQKTAKGMDIRIKPPEGSLATDVDRPPPLASVAHMKWWAANFEPDKVTKKK
ncbi:hypothetical protein BKA62DRAFT_684952 [Auriculariales sp. MPI-PUGE-AT-0066]|nr:hypothetical protein BKA62DRAFT_684952 [Auriculariales sp. MPI-PUGE-AT-0066]